MFCSATPLSASTQWERRSSGILEAVGSVVGSSVAVFDLCVSRRANIPLVRTCRTDSLPHHSRSPQGLPVSSGTLIGVP